MRSIGVDIGDYSVKLVELVQNKKSVYINQYQEKVLSQNVSKEDKELEVIEFIRNFAASADYSQAKWVVALRQQKVTTRYKSFPFADRLKIQKSLSFEMEEDIPFDTDNCIFDSKVVTYNGVGADVLASAIPRAQIEDIVDHISNYGVEIHALTIEGMAFSNLIENWENPPPKVTANLSLDEEQKPKKFVQVILNIGHKSTLLTAYENNRLILARSLFWGTSQVIEEIIKKNSISYVEAVKMLQSQAVILLNKENASFDQTQTSGLITKCAKELSRDVQMTLLELQSEFNAEVTALHFTGGASLLPNLGAFLTQQLEVACNPIQLITKYTGALNQSGASLALIESRFATAVGIAIEGFKKPKNPAINLLKGEFAKQNDGMKNLWEQWGSFIQICAAAVLVLFVWANLRDQFSITLFDKSDEAIKAQAQSVARLPRRQANEAGVKKYIRENKKKITEMKLVAQVAQMNSALDIIKKVSETAPAKDQVKVDIVSFIVRDENVSISGYATSAQAVNVLANSLKSLSSDGVVSNQRGNLSIMPNRTPFNISFRTERGVVK